MMTPATYVLATTKPWNLAAFERARPNLPGRWIVITNPTDLAHDVLMAIAPRYIFFPHWSAIVPEEVTTRFDCVCFHMSDVPYGRGGSPLQNLIVRGHTSTQISALKMIRDVDAGPVYLKRRLDLDGSAQEIFVRAADIIWTMVAEIIANEPVPAPQAGEAMTFKRRTPDQSALPEDGELRQVYDHIRMLDAEGYPHAFCDYGAWRLDFRNAHLRDDIVEACVTIRKNSRT